MKEFYILFHNGMKRGGERKMETTELLEYYEKSCRWCKDFRGKDDPIVCDNDNPCLTREDLTKMRKVVKEWEA